MIKGKMVNCYSPEVRARAVRMLFEHQGSYETQVRAVAAIAPKIGCIPQTLYSPDAARMGQAGQEGPRNARWRDH